MGELSKKTITRFDKARDSFRSARRSIRRGNERETLEQVTKSFELYIPAVVAAFQDVKHELNLLEIKLDKIEIKLDKMEHKIDQPDTGHGSGVDLSKIEVKLDKMEGKVDKMEVKIDQPCKVDVPPVDLSKIEAKLDKILLLPTVTLETGGDPEIPTVTISAVKPSVPGVRR